MRVLAKSIDKILPRNRLYLDDLSSIYNILKEHYERVFIQTDKYEISDIEQLRKLESDKLRELTFICYEANLLLPCARIYFRNNYYARVLMDKETTLSKGILAEIEQVVSRRKQRITSVLSNNAFIGSFSLIALGLEMWLMNIEASSLLILLLLLLLIVYYVYWFWLTSNNYSIIMLYERKEHPNFFKRNTDRILVGIIVGVIVAVVSVLLTLIATHYF